MTIDWNAEVVDQIESHWRHQLRPRLEGLTDDEYSWEPTAERVPAGVTTIAWRLGHVTEGLQESNESHFGGRPAGDFGEAAGAEEALSQLDAAFEQWLNGVRDLGESGLVRSQGPTSPPEFAGEPMARLILFTSVELIHHGAEVCLLRDLYPNRAQSLG